MVETARGREGREGQTTRTPRAEECQSSTTEANRGRQRQPESCRSGQHHAEATHQQNRGAEDTNRGAEDTTCRRHVSVGGGIAAAMYTHPHCRIRNESVLHGKTKAYIRYMHTQPQVNKRPPPSPVPPLSWSGEETPSPLILQNPIGVISEPPSHPRSPLSAFGP